MHSTSHINVIQPSHLTLSLWSSDLRSPPPYITRGCWREYIRWVRSGSRTSQVAFECMYPVGARVASYLKGLMVVSNTSKTENGIRAQRYRMPVHLKRQWTWPPRNSLQMMRGVVKHKFHSIAALSPMRAPELKGCWTGQKCCSQELEFTNKVWTPADYQIQVCTGPHVHLCLGWVAIGSTFVSTPT